LYLIPYAAGEVNETEYVPDSSNNSMIEVASAWICENSGIIGNK
jgi:hypothetical protein